MTNYIMRRGAEADTLNAVINSYEATNSPRAVVDSLIDSMGEAGAVKAVATLVNAVSLFDGRIKNSNREWAQSEDAPSHEELQNIGIYGVDSWIHSTHVDNIADAMRSHIREKAEQAEREEPTASATLTPEAVAEFESNHGSRAAADLLTLCPADCFSGDYSKTLKTLEDRATLIEEAQKRQRQTDDENQEHCERIAQELDQIADGLVYICPECGGMFNIAELEEDEEGRRFCPSCNEEIDTAYCEQLTMWDYFNDAFDIQYTIDSNGAFRGVRLMVTCGGPNIYVDTNRGSVVLYWWGDTAHYMLNDSTIDAINDAFEEYYNCTR